MQNMVDTQEDENGVDVTNENREENDVVDGNEGSGLDLDVRFSKIKTSLYCFAGFGPKSQL